MPKFKYVAIDPSGAKVTGVVEAASAVRVRNELAGRELRTVEVTERKSLARVEITTKKLKPVDLMNFSRQFAAFLRAGIPILDALQALVDETANAQLKAVLIDIYASFRKEAEAALKAPGTLSSEAGQPAITGAAEPTPAAPHDRSTVDSQTAGIDPMPEGAQHVLEH